MNVNRLVSTGNTAERWFIHALRLAHGIEQFMLFLQHAVQYQLWLAWHGLYFYCPIHMPWKKEFLKIPTLKTR